MASWISFWDGANAVYVNGHHKAVHYLRIAADLARFVPAPDARVLDFGCGEALAADRLAERCAALVLCDAAPTVREALKARHAGNPKIEVLSPEEVAALPDGSFNLIVVNSVLQYIPKVDLPALLAGWRRLLLKGGSLLLADVIPPDVGMVKDVTALLRFATKEGFLPAALVGLARTAVSPYRKLRTELGLTFYEEDEMLRLLETARLPASRVRPNIGHNQNRMAFQAFRLR
ncbi:class I SAM-dependent methyltransferase [Xanthobacter pseudotagetidis]|uniref:class I SAM-dependent methyltransferase n=1 Tax=Xanthobacter pseudotagetidis TaxID=3119911 RepID=UPI003729A7B9